MSYRLADICGLLVNKKSVKSLARAAGFLKGVLKKEESQISFFSYDASKGRIQKESMEEMKAAKHCRKFNKKVCQSFAVRYLICFNLVSSHKFKDYASFYETIWASDRM